MGRGSKRSARDARSEANKRNARSEANKRDARGEANPSTQAPRKSAAVISPSPGVVDILYSDLQGTVQRLLPAASSCSRSLAPRHHALASACLPAEREGEMRGRG
jgi:hypothetical protein